VLVGAEGAGLFEQAVHERGLAVVNVRDDRNVSNVLHKSNRKTVWPQIPVRAKTQYKECGYILFSNRAG
jgi:hypothetical protein